MRIAHFLVGRCNPDSANGVDKTAFFLCKSQASLGYTVAMFSLTSKPPISIPGVTVKAYPPKRLAFLLPQLLLRDLRDWRPDVVHLHSVYVPPNVALTTWLRAQRIPYVITPHGALSPHVLRRRWYLKIPYKVFCDRPSMNRAMFVHAVADADADDIRHYGVRTPIFIAPNGFDISTLPPDCNKTVLSSRFPQIQGKRVFLFLGRLDPLHKGLDLLLEGFALSRPQNVILALVGPDWRNSRNTLQRLSHKLNIESEVIFAGPAYNKDKFDLLARADVFVHTSRWEGLPFAVLEAAAMGIPCLVTPVADPCKMLSKYQASIVVEPNAGSIAAGLQKFATINNLELRIMGARARQMVEEEFDWEHIAEKLSRTYKLCAQNIMPTRNNGRKQTRGCRNGA